MPALQEAEKINKKAAKTGLDWPDVHGIVAKLKEETDELSMELNSTEASSERIEDEIGDLFFTVANIARYLKVDPETALRRANGKFRRRFAALESAAWASGRDVHDLSVEEMDQYWNEAKEIEQHG